MADKTLTALTAASAFAATDLLYGKVGADSRKISGTVLTAFLATATLAAGTLTTSQPMTLTQTWNASGVTFTGLLVNITNTASAAASLLMDLQVGGTSQFKVSKAAVVTIGAGGDNTQQLIFTPNSGDNASLGMGNGGGPLVLFNGGAVQSMALGGAGQLALVSTGYIAWTNSATLPQTTQDLFLLRDAANALGQRNGTTSQTSNHYDTWASATDYHRLAIKTARATLSNVSGASVTATALIPDGAVLVGLTSKVTTGLGVSLGTTGYTIGDGTDVDRWGAIVGTAAGTSSDNTNWTATTIQAFIAAQDVVVTATGGNFDATGVIYLSAQYLIGQAD